MRRFIPRKDLIDSLGEDTMRLFITKFLDKVDECQTHPYYKPNLEKLGHEMLRTAFEFGLVNLNQGCPGCSGGSCHSPAEDTTQRKTDKTSGSGKVLPFKRLN
ncbi:hypothetical protein [Desulforamulus aeronauticus]|uniref:Uncharacterized protein n=1 Tax=Desulforamulus aeronauticus DSM 10349 TaxID=1121421 RepID=A0A1M6PVA8_9FIRM|nr:hypothetical protein [Desulforamulus aeronauticus]SHK11832.1 hypothetical protein SAMN02745123_00728 [Desulforamulus aeronauticus DSM 10349]